MTGRVLVVDDVLANVKLLQARLSAEYFEVLTARSGEEALEVLQRECVDVVLLDVMMPGMDGFEVCRRIKTATRTKHVPVVMVTALDQTCDRVQGLEAGADDFIAKPVDDIALITRVKNLARLKTLNDEMVLRMATGAQIGAPPGVALAWSKAESSGRILLVEDGERAVRLILAVLGERHEVEVEANVLAALARIADHDHQPELGRGRRFAPVQPGARARAHAPSADHRHRAAGRGCPPPACARHGGKRLSDPPRRSQRAARPRAYTDQAQGTFRRLARPPAERRAGSDGCADGAR
jgi:CheY-like chemotaxis protein